MKTSRKYFEMVAKTLYKKSLTKGLVDDKKVHLILKELANKKPAGLSPILKAYKRLITQKVASEEIVIETNSKMPLAKNFLDDLKKKTGAQRVINKINPDIVFGARITLGDKVWEDTLEDKLKQIVKKDIL